MAGIFQALVAIGTAFYNCTPPPWLYARVWEIQALLSDYQTTHLQSQFAVYAARQSISIINSEANSHMRNFVALNVSTRTADKLLLTLACTRCATDAGESSIRA